MFSCIVCGFSCKLSNDLRNHVHRHRKSDLISAVFKLPTVVEGANTSNEEVNTHEVNNNGSNSLSQVELKRSRVGRGNLRRSSRNKDFAYRCAADKEAAHGIDDNYYMPAASTSKLPSISDDDDDDDDDDSDESIIIRQLKKNKLRRKVGKQAAAKRRSRLDPVLATPKAAKHSPSDTDSCSAGNGNVNATCVDERVFCTYCGSGYRNEIILSEHIRHNHLNFCTMCEVNFPDLRRYREHVEKHLLKVYVCHYCEMEFSAKDIFALHVERHVQSSALDDVLSLEEQFFTEKTYMNTMYNMFNAGFQYGRRALRSFDSTIKLPPEFYKVFLQYATADAANTDSYGHLCRTCGFTLFDESHYRDHMQIAHGIECDVEEFLSI